jgi:hypothetical protein
VAPSRERGEVDGAAGKKKKAHGLKKICEYPGKESQVPPLRSPTRHKLCTGAPTFAPAYVGRNRWGEAPTIAVETAESIGRKSFSAHVRWCERRAPVQSFVSEGVHYQDAFRRWWSGRVDYPDTSRPK